ncbi:hypothetical protein AVEN_22710-1, partial [Araneus ventricosus]
MYKQKQWSPLAVDQLCNQSRVTLALSKNGRWDSSDTDVGIPVSIFGYRQTLRKEVCYVIGEG